jgi:hypothetical protein
LAVLTLRLLGEAPHAASPAAIDSALRALRASGLEREALQLGAAVLMTGPADDPA